MTNATATAAMHQLPSTLDLAGLQARFAAFAAGREKLLAVAAGTLGGVGFLLGTATTGMAGGCAVPTTIAAIELATLV